jgi:uncharacterized protein with beta-barrel porin domain
MTCRQVFGELGYGMAFNGLAVEPFTGVAHTWVNTAAFAFASAAFTVTGVPIATIAALVEAEIDWRLDARMKFGVAYQGTIAHHPKLNTVKGSFTWDW